MASHKPKSKAATSGAAEGQTSPARPPASQPLKVRATRLGYYDHVRRRVGDVFTIRLADFTETWMEGVDARTAEHVTTSQQELRRQHDELLRERTPASGTPLVDDTLPTGSRNPLDS